MSKPAHCTVVILFKVHFILSIQIDPSYSKVQLAIIVIQLYKIIIFIIGL